MKGKAKLVNKESNWTEGYKWKSCSGLVSGTVLIAPIGMFDTIVNEGQPDFEVKFNPDWEEKRTAVYLKNIQK